MISKHTIIETAHAIGFDDIGFTTADPFADHREILQARKDEYAWISKMGLDLEAGCDPLTVMPDAKSIIVVLDLYFRQAFPAFMEGHFGRCYLDDDRVTKDGLSLRIKKFRAFLKAHGIESKVPFNLPHRAAAARSGVGNFGKNCLLYAHRTGRKSSWVIPVALVIDRRFDPDPSTQDLGCPEWCKNVCIAACPTRALTGPRTIHPKRCISYLTYFGKGITPHELREPMGTYVYGCDRCQNVCPRNTAWLAQDLDRNSRVAEMASHFNLSRLLHMNAEYFQSHVWPHMFYMGVDDIWRWKMNVARAMGNTYDEAYVTELIRAFKENPDERVRGMSAWSLGRIGGSTARNALEEFRHTCEGTARQEVDLALERIA